jgi:large subunit ribosomal protein L15
MQTHQLKRIHGNTKRMTVARGGKRGKTSGRGGKGQTARAGNKRRPEWRDIIKKLPKLRGRGKNSNISFYKRAVPINLAVLESSFASGDMITPAVLAEKGIVSTLSGRILEVKILGEGEITKSFKVSGCAISISAKAAIEKAGGTVVLVKPKAKTKIAAERTGPKAGTVDSSAPKEKTEAAKGSNKKAKDSNKISTAPKSEAVPSKDRSNVQTEKKA